MQHFDMVVIGSGPSGRRAAIQSAKLGKTVLVVDKGSRLGGVSVIDSTGLNALRDVITRFRRTGTRVILADEISPDG